MQVPCTTDFSNWPLRRRKKVATNQWCLPTKSTSTQGYKHRNSKTLGSGWQVCTNLEGGAVHKANAGGHQKSSIWKQFPVSNSPNNAQTPATQIKGNRGPFKPTSKSIPVLEMSVSPQSPDTRPHTPDVLYVGRAAAKPSSKQAAASQKPATQPTQTEYVQPDIWLGCHTRVSIRSHVTGDLIWQIELGFFWLSGVPNWPMKRCSLTNYPCTSVLLTPHTQDQIEYVSLWANMQCIAVYTFSRCFHGYLKGIWMTNTACTINCNYF